MYYGRRYLRLAFTAVVVSIIIVVVLMLASSNYNFNGISVYGATKQIKPKFEFKPKGNSILTKFTLLYSKNGDKQNLIEVFPLDAALTDNRWYSEAKLKTYVDPLPFVKDKAADYQFKPENDCKYLEFESSLYHTSQIYLPADFNMIQKALGDREEYTNLIELAKDKFKSDIPLEKRWFRFGGSSVWLQQYELHYMVSRVFYSPSGIPNKGFVSFLYVQLFDKNWKELPETTLNVPYEKKIMKSTTNSDATVSEVLLETKLGSREVTYPKLLPIPFDVQMTVANGYHGPEDPRILLRANPLGYDEPLIVFNMKNTELSKRVMHLYLPFSNHLKYLKKRSDPYAHIEKNWTPFISKTNPQKINFIYSIDPLEVLTCEVETGICDFLQKLKKKDFNYVGPLRGGTQLVHLPFDDLVPEHVIKKFKLPKNRQIYIGWARAHLNKCGCGESMYRPNLIILVEDFNPDEKKYYYKLADISEYFDFSARIPPWAAPKLDSNGNLIEVADTSLCKGRNVLIPNSIAYWEIKSIIKDNSRYDRKLFDKIPTNENPAIELNSSQDNSSDHLEFDDYMGVTLSAADSDVSIVHVKGLLNYILKLPSLFDESTVVSDKSAFQPREYDLNNKCAMLASKDYCVKYAKNHGGK